MEKYYTPELEEFHVGFEYYITTHPVSMEEFSPYVKAEFDHNTFEREFDIDTDSSGEIIKIGVPSCIKVKYLDREDIESLGFKQGKLPYQYFSDCCTVYRFPLLFFSRWSSRSYRPCNSILDFCVVVGGCTVFFPGGLSA